jgi:hypothetical protein
MAWNDGERKITIGLDYDDTYTADPGLWDAFIKLARKRGHSVVCVSCRPETEENMAEMNIPGVLTYLTSMSPKEWFMREQCIQVDVWIDDHPDCVKNGR